MLFFAGIKHSGKTTFARMTAAHYGLPHIDNDDLILSLIEEESVREFYKKHGKEAFMETEVKALSDYLDKHIDSVISLGGGASDNQALLSLVKAHGPLIYLRRAEKDMLPVILRDGIPAFLDKDDPEGSFHELYERRDRIYRENAALTVELGPYGDKGEVLARILDAIRSYYGR
jgi:Shikimate kinase